MMSEQGLPCTVLPSALVVVAALGIRVAVWQSDAASADVAMCPIANSRRAVTVAIAT